MIKEETINNALRIIIGVSVIEIVLYGTYKLGMFCLENHDWAEVCNGILYV